MKDNTFSCTYFLFPLSLAGLIGLCVMFLSPDQRESCRLVQGQIGALIGKQMGRGHRGHAVYVVCLFLLQYSFNASSPQLSLCSVGAT